MYSRTYMYSRVVDFSYCMYVELSVELILRRRAFAFLTRDMIDDRPTHALVRLVNFHVFAYAAKAPVGYELSLRMPHAPHTFCVFGYGLHSVPLEGSSSVAQLLLSSSWR